MKEFVYIEYSESCFKATTGSLYAENIDDAKIKIKKELDISRTSPIGEWEVISDFETTILHTADVRYGFVRTSVILIEKKD